MTDIESLNTLVKNLRIYTCDICKHPALFTYPEPQPEHIEAACDGCGPQVGAGTRPHTRHDT